MERRSPHDLAATSEVIAHMGKYFLLFNKLSRAGLIAPLFFICLSF